MNLVVWLVGGCIVGGILFYKYVFLRDNPHPVPQGQNLVSPASGKVVSIMEVDGQTPLKIRKGFLGNVETSLESEGPYWLINIFMSPFDVHYNKMPLDGTVQHIKRQKGKFLPVMTVDAGLQNEKQEFLIDTDIGLVKVIQIAGFLARRTKSFVAQGQTLTKGERLGIITLGSQCALLFPRKEYTLNVAVGDKVRVGETILCHL